MAQRKQYSGEFKAKVVVHALKGSHTVGRGYPRRPEAYVVFRG